jgi:hypothetical protein
LAITVLNGGSQRLGKEIYIFKARHQARLLGGENLAVIKISGVRDHYLVKHFSRLLLRRFLQFS